MVFGAFFSYIRKKLVNARQCYKRGLEITLQNRDRKARQKILDLRNLEPGTIRYGIKTRQNAWDFSKDHYQRRKRLREEKQR